MAAVTKLRPEDRSKAEEFILAHGRELERALLAHDFHGGEAENVYGALAEYQNDDGGFGKALEPDVRMDGSSVIATTIGLQVLRRMKADENHTLVQSALRYLGAKYIARAGVWEIVPPAVDRAPRAPWWQYDGDLTKFALNPRAEIVGYLWDYPSVAPEALREELTLAVVERLEDGIEPLEMHEALCCARLAETETLPQKHRGRVMAPIVRALDDVVVRDPAGWRGYGMKPLTLVESPASPFAAMLSTDIQANLDYEIESRQDDGSWAPNWDWGDAFPAEWEQAEREWRGILTLHTLRVLRNFGRLD